MQAGSELSSDQLAHLISHFFYQSMKAGKIFSKKCISGAKSKIE
jgi:hypothetical protein